MQVQSVKNSQTNLNFKSDFYADDLAFINMSNSELKSLATYIGSDSRESREKRKSIVKTFCAIPIIDTLASGILAAKIIPKFAQLPCNEGLILEDFEIKGASLAERTSIMGGKAGFWGAAILGVVAYNKIKHALFPKTYEPGGFSQEHPILSFFTDVALIIGGFTLGAKGLVKGIESLDKNYPKFVSKVSRKIAKFLIRLDKSAANKKYLPQIEKSAVELAQKFPRTAFAGVMGLALSVPILFVVALFKTIRYDHQEKRRVHENYHDLKEIQLKIAKQLARRLDKNQYVLAN